MTEDKLAFIDDKAESTPDVTAQAVPPIETTTPIIEPPAPQLQEPPKGDGPQVPLPKYLDAYNEARELKRRLAEIERKEQEGKQEPPDPVVDPEGYAKYVQASQSREFETRIEDQKFNMSEIMARQVHGTDVVDAAFDALKERGNPFEITRIKRSAHPWDEIVKWHKREKLLGDIGDNEEAYILRRYAEIQQKQQGATPPTPQVVPPPSVAIPAPSLSKAPASGKSAADIPSGPGQIFDSVFPP